MLNSSKTGTSARSTPVTHAETAHSINFANSTTFWLPRLAMGSSAPPMKLWQSSGANDASP